MTTPATRHTVLSLYHKILKESNKFASYNYREYTKRRSRDAFKANKNVTDPAKIQQLLQFGEQNFNVIKRQALVNSLYHSQKLVVE